MSTSPFSHQPLSTIPPIIAFQALMGILQIGAVAGWRLAANAARVAVHSLSPGPAMGALPLAIALDGLLDGLLDRGASGGTHFG